MSKQEELGVKLDCYSPSFVTYKSLMMDGYREYSSFSQLNKKPVIFAVIFILRVNV